VSEKNRELLNDPLLDSGGRIGNPLDDGERLGEATKVAEELRVSRACVQKLSHKEAAD
jgi:hypothetical protein